MSHGLKIHRHRGERIYFFGADGGVLGSIRIVSKTATMEADFEKTVTIKREEAMSAKELEQVKEKRRP